MPLARFIRRSVARKMLAAVGLPAFAVALAGVLWLRHEARGQAPGLEPVFGLAIAGLVLFTVGLALSHLLAVRLLVERPLRGLTAALRRAREGDFLHRFEARGEDELAELARTLNSTLAAITDLHALRLDDAASLTAMQREVALKAQLEARLRELELLHRLAGVLAATLDVDGLVRGVAELAAERMPGTALALLLFDDATGDLVIRATSALDPQAIGTRLAGSAGLAARAVVERRALRADGEAARAALPWTPSPPASAVAIPLLLPAGGSAGVIVVGRPTRDAFGDSELRLLESAAQQTATALESARLHQTMVRLSQTDTLTGVQNRRQLFARLELERQRAARFGEPFALLLLDIDRFRELNEAAGHAAGDQTLREVAALLGREVRPVDLVARYGGEEFAVVLTRAGAAEALETAERLRQAVAGSGFDAAPGGRLTVSVGGASLPADARDLAALVDCADAALFAAKRAGRNASRMHAPGMRQAPGRRRDVGTTGKA